MATVTCKMLLRRLAPSLSWCSARFFGNGNVTSVSHNYEVMQVPALDLNQGVSGLHVNHRKENAPISFAKPITFNENAERLNLRKLNGGCVDLKRDDETGVAMVSISNPGKSNAMSGSMMVDLADIVSDLEQWKRGKAVLLHGSLESGAFCAGADLRMARAISNPEEGTEMCLFMQNTLNRMLRLPLISAAVIHGAAVGGGAEVTTACDFRLMTANASIQFVHMYMGITPGWGGGARLVQIVGPQTALKLLASGRSVSSQNALQLNLVDGIIDGDDILSSAGEWIKAYTKASPETVQAIKGVVLAGRELPLDSAMKKEKDLFSGLWGGPDHQKGLRKVFGDSD